MAWNQDPDLNSGYLKNPMGSLSCNEVWPCPRTRPPPLQFRTLQDPDSKRWVRSKSWPAQAPTDLSSMQNTSSSRHVGLGNMWRDGVKRFKETFGAVKRLLERKGFLGRFIF